ncbi:major facilitator superfamily domain-containing protein [Nemania sp. NC0429]|nr:major facilitator superfamily domain-containing protein [Nemania sp. NC0429]
MGFFRGLWQAQIIGRTFNSSDTGWVTGVLVIGGVTLGPIVSQGADLWGRKWFFVVLSGFGFVGSVIVARAQNMPTVLGGFTIIGLPGLAFGAQGLVHAVSGEVIPRRWRSWDQAAALVSTELGLVTGLIVAGGLNRTGSPDGFRNFYYITAALFFTAGLLCVLTYNPPATQRQLENIDSAIKRLDWIGFGLLASCVVLFSIALNWSHNPYSWDDPHVSVPFSISVLLAILLVLHGRRKPDVLFHHGLFQERMFPICLVCIFVEGFSFYAANVYVPYQATTFYDHDFLFPPLRLAVGFPAAMVASIVTGLYCFLTKRVRWATFSALVIFVSFFAGMAAAVRLDDSGSALWGLPVLFGWAFGMVLVILVTAAQLCVPPALITISSCLVVAARALGGTVGFSVYHAVFQSAVSHLDNNIAEAALAKGLPPASVSKVVEYYRVARNTSTVPDIPGVNSVIAEAAAVALKKTYQSGFYNVWVTGAAFASAAAIISIFMYDPSSEFTLHIDAPIE